MNVDKRIQLVVNAHNQKAVMIIRRISIGKCPLLLKYIVKRTNFLDSSCSLSERIYCIYHNITSKVICPYCNIKTLRYFMFSIGYIKYCSRKCSANDPIKKIKIKNTINQNGGYSIKANKASKTMSIKNKDGISIHQLRITKMNDTKIKNNIYYQASKKASITMKNDIDSFGRSKYERVGQYNHDKKTISLGMIKHGHGIPLEKREKYIQYVDEIKYMTRKNKKMLFKLWDGYDYYDKEYIRHNLNLHYNHKNYPTIDHKISIFEGFNLNISPDKMGHMDNLCITKRTINSSKKHRKWKGPNHE